MKANSGHLIFDKKVKRSDLAKHMDSILDAFFKESKQSIEEPEYLLMIKALNRSYLERDLKPEGFNHPGRMRMIFPIRDDGIIEMTIIGTASGMEIARVTEAMSVLLNARELNHTIQWDEIPKKSSLYSS